MYRRLMTRLAAAHDGCPLGDAIASSTQSGEQALRDVISSAMKPDEIPLSPGLGLLLWLLLRLMTAKVQTMRRRE
jgi:hypothetical protein